MLAALVDSPQQTAVQSISELARAQGVNASTVTRLAKRLGYTGFAQMQNVFRLEVSQTDRYYSQRVGELLKAHAGAGLSSSLVVQVAEDELSNISTMVRGLDAQTVDEAAELLRCARRVRVHGLRQMYAIASFFSYALGLLRRDVALLSTAAHGFCHGLGQLETRDVLVAISSSPYTRETVEACRMADSLGIPIIALTDSYGSPIAQVARCVLTAPWTGTSYMATMAAPMVLTEILLGVVAGQLGDAAMTNLQHHEALLRNLDFQRHED
jgi:DNA-binding MurR/RpiR family transcriptional regulator